MNVEILGFNVNVHNRADWPVLFATFGISNIGFDN